MPGFGKVFENIMGERVYDYLDMMLSYGPDPAS